MKRAFIALASFAAFLPATLAAQTTSQQALPDLPHQVGLIDLAYVFKNSQKFLALTDALQKEIEKTDGEAKLIVERIRKLQADLEANQSPTAAPSLEEALLKAKAELETFKRVSQQSFLRQEADIYKTVYLDVEDAVRRYATYYKYTLVLRFDRAELGGNSDPRDVMNSMNRQVVHFRGEDDMTEPVLKFLNNEWQKNAGQPPVETAAEPAAPAKSSGGAPARR